MVSTFTQPGVHFCNPKVVHFPQRKSPGFKVFLGVANKWSPAPQCHFGFAAAMPGYLWQGLEAVRAAEHPLCAFLCGVGASPASRGAGSMAVLVIWVSYKDPTRPHPKWWFMLGVAPKAPYFRLVKYYNSPRSVSWLEIELHWYEH